MLRKLRIAVLLVILVIVALKTWQEQHLSRRWRVPLYVSIYPIAADDSAVTRSYLEHLDAERNVINCRSRSRSARACARSYTIAPRSARPTLACSRPCSGA
jgi:hypothetical protein